MSALSNRLTVIFIPPYVTVGPVEGRTYTLTHSDETGELFLSVGGGIDSSKIDWKMRDEVIGTWQIRGGQYYLVCSVHISAGEFDENKARARYSIFKEEMPLALKGIINGDKGLFGYYPWLLNAPVQVEFCSIYPEFNQVMYYGLARHYQEG
ncbi:staygreen family protein [Pradoshia sp.]|uniref:staygreen family protein n=1 Tax=Pradoshia sp. TaxID=2651281 RepID=UPI003F0CF3B0